MGRVNGAEASGFDADGINRKTILFFTGFPSKLENDGAGRRRPPEGAGTLSAHRHSRHPKSAQPSAVMTGVTGIQRNKGRSPVITAAEGDGDTARFSGLVCR